jgi:hypothetical protein
LTRPTKGACIVRCAVLAFALAAPALAEEPLRAPVNLSFAAAAPGVPPSGWGVSSASGGTTVETMAEGCVEGVRCARLRRKESGPGYDALLELVRADAYRGKRIRLRANLRRTGGAGQAFLYLQVNRPGPSYEARTGPAAVEGWRADAVWVDVARDAETFQLGLVVTGPAEAWIDAVAVETLGEAGLGNEPARALTNSGVANLAALGHLMGLVRYFHPSDESAALDWPAWTLEAVGRVEGARDATELARVLGRLVRPIAPAARIFRSGEPLPPFQVTTAPGAWKIAWRHAGLGTGTARSEGKFASRRVGSFGQRPDDVGLPDPSAPLVADLGGGVSVRLPLALFADSRGTLPQGTGGGFERRKPEGFMPAGDDRATRIADVLLLGAAIDHFYPYPLTDWPASLDRALRAAAEDRDERSFLDTLRRLVADLRDDHATVGHASDRTDARLPLLWRVIKDRLLITWADPALDTVRVGDTVAAVDGVPALTALARLETLVSAATPAYRRYRALELLSVGAKGAARTLRLQRGKENLTVTLHATAPFLGPGRLRGARPDRIAELQPGLFYLDLDRIDDGDFEAALPRLKDAKGLIFDLRGYPERISETLLAHLIPAPARTPGTWTAIRTRPDAPPRLDHLAWTIQPLAPRLAARAVFLADERAYSRAETYLDMVSFYHLGEIVGATTGGTNGEVDDMDLPGGYHVTWTGSRVERLDGGEIQRVGIPPTVPVSPSAEGLAAGRDEVLERAAAILR